MAPYVQPLESRNLLAAVSLTAAGTLLIQGTSSADDITVTQAGNSLLVSTADSGVSQAFEKADVKRVYVDAAGGDDRVSIGKNVSKLTTVLGGNGDDRLFTSGNRTTLVGGAGNDELQAYPKTFRVGPGAEDGTFVVIDTGALFSTRLEGGTGDDVIFGRAGQIVEAGGGHDTLRVPAGVDVITSGGAQQTVAFRLSGVYAGDVEVISTR
jgi:Ca2+-binding RTX toxin-like protein